MKDDDLRLARELERQLKFALEPDQARLQRVRATVLASYRATMAGAPRQSPRFFLRRWVVAGAIAATLVGGAGLAAAESGPGQPLYEVRLAIGSWLLPSEGAARDRGLAAELDDRLAEVRAASRRGDSGALGAALAAYRRTLAELTSHGISDPTVLLALERHRDVLQRLVDDAPPAAQGGLQQALQDAEKAAAGTPNAAPSVEPKATPVENPHGSDPPSHRP